MYPSQLLLQGIQGRLELLVEVGTDGVPRNVRVRKSSGYQAMDQSARDAIRRWRFAPVRRGQTPVSIQVVVPVDFRIRRGP